MTLEDLLPLNDVPQSGNPQNREETWFGTDHLQSFRSRAEKSWYQENSISYRFNENGYRGPAIETDCGLKLLSIGCGWTFGVGVPEEATFHEAFARRLRHVTNAPVTAWNLGTSGTSNDRIARLLHLALPELNPHMVLVVFAPLSRREYVAPHNRSIDYVAEQRVSGPVDRELWRHFRALHSIYDDQLNFFRNYKSIESLLSDRPWVFAFESPSEIGFVANHLDRTHWAKEVQMTDRGRDGLHPGPLTHQAISDTFWRTLLGLVGDFAKLTAFTSATPNYTDSLPNPEHL